MNRILRTHPGAFVDLIEAREHYESIQPGLGDRFYHSLRSTFDVIAARPTQYGRVWRAWRATLVKKFPFKVIYRLDGKDVFVVAIVHASRHDRVWRRRV